jgi:hypothetical protein
VTIGMIALELIKEVKFEEVKQELLVTDSSFGNVLPQLENYYESLKNVELSSVEEKNKIQVSREYFDTSFFIGKEEKSAVEEVTDFVPVELILASEIAEEDLADLEKPLIVAGLLNLLTFNGTCFSEEERKTDVESLKQRIEELNV